VLAEALQADFWTADKRLVDSLKSKKLAWLHWIGEVS
jgi:predicted nucleic acid-binding protein